MAYFARRDIYSSIASSLATSGITSETYNVEGFNHLTLQIVGSTSTTTVQGSNDYGRTSAADNWSLISAVINGGLVSVDPGFAWVRALRSNSSEPSAVIVGGWRDLR